MDADIKFVKRGGCLWAFYSDPPFIGIDDVLTWLEWFMIIGLTHETIHLVLYEVINYETAFAFDNWFGMVDPSVLLVPEDDYMYNQVQRERTEKLWERLKRKSH